jgi:integrase
MAEANVPEATPTGTPRAMRRRATGHVYLVKRKRGDQWYAKYRLPNGRQVQKRLGPAWPKRGRAPESYYTRAGAEAALASILAAADRGELDSHRGHSFDDACKEWLRYLAHEKRVSLTTLRHNRSAVRARLAPFFGAQTPLDDITTARIDAYREHALVERGLSPSTVQRDLTNLSGILRRAKRKRWISSNPYDDAERVRIVDSGDFNVLTVEQLEAVARVAANAQDAALYRVAGYSGLRQGELRALRWRDVDFAAATLHVRRNLPAHGEEKVPKSKVVRSVPLIDQAARALDGLSRRPALTAPGDRVFISPTGGPLDDGDVREAFYATLAAAGLGHLREQEEPITFHDLRHTFGTLAVQVWPLTDVQAYMGHADIKTTMRYVHHVPKHDAAERFSQFVSQMCPELGIAGGTEANSAQLRTA